MNCDRTIRLNRELGIMVSNSYDDSPQFEMLSLNKIVGIVEILTNYMIDGKMKSVIDKTYIVEKIINQYGLKTVYNEVLVEIINKEESYEYCKELLDNYIAKINKIRKNKNKPYINCLIEHSVYDFTSYINDIRRGYYPDLIDEPMKHVVRAFISKGYHVMYCCSGHGDANHCSPYISILDPDTNVIKYITTSVRNKAGDDNITCEIDNLDEDGIKLVLRAPDTYSDIYKSNHVYINNFRKSERFINRLTYVVDGLQYRNAIRRKKWEVIKHERIMGEFISKHDI